MKILIIEDEKKTASHLSKGLAEHGFEVDLSHHGGEGLHLAMTGDHTLIILDVMLPHRDGWSILNEIRGSRLATPVIFLTARDGVDDRVKGLELGADDYLVKPFAFPELLARVRSVLRRRPPRQEEILAVSDLEIDLQRHRATRAGRPLQLTAREFVLLCMLARSEGEVVSRSRIVKEVWEIEFEANTNLVEVAVRRLRSKVDDPFDLPLIHTVRGVGYVCEAR